MNVGNGSLKLPLVLNTYYTVIGGRSHDVQKFQRQREQDGKGRMFFVKMAEEIRIPCDVDIPTRDFSLPPLDLFDKGLIETVSAITRGEQVYGGCMGGIGRTGLLLAVLAKCFGVNDPVAYVRKHYMGHAVETEEQKQFVAEYEPPFEVVSLIAGAKWSNFWRVFMPNLTN